MAKTEEKNKTLVLLDSQAIIHRAYHAMPEFATSKGVPTGALYGLSNMLLKIITELKPDYIVACYDLPKPTYRHIAYKEYKAHRAKAAEDLVDQIKKSYDIFHAFNIPIYSHEGFEADDMIGTIVEKTKKEKNLNVIIASGDMDTLQLVDDDRVRVYTLKKGISDTILYNEKAVNERYGFGPEFLPDYKGLCGDQSDNIPGIKGIGDKSATDLITQFGHIEDIYKKLKKGKKEFEKAGIKERIIGLLETGEEEANFSKMLGTINREAPIDWKMPGKTWREAIDTEKINSVWTDLEFRTLGTRLKNILDGKEEIKGKKESKNMEEEKSPARTQEMFSFSGSEEKMKELEIMLWLINSNITNPKAEDIYNFTKAKNLDDAEKIISKEIEKRKLEGVWEKIEKPLISIIDEMEKVGFKIDKKEMERLSKDYHKSLSLLEKKIWDLAGSEFNINSPKQLGEIIFVKLGLKAKSQKKTAGGAFSTKESELEKLREMNPIINLIIEYREFQKLLSTYIDVIPELLDKDNRLHTKFLQAGTTTGRLASSNPNLQNIPNESELGRNIRAAFIADKGTKLLSFDYSQAELRIAAFMAPDEKLLEIFRNGMDVHAAVASEVFNVPLDKVDKEMRRRAKVINFGIMYGMGANALRINLSGAQTIITEARPAYSGAVSREEAQKYLNEYFNKFSGLAKYLERIKAEAKEKGYTETFFGRRRYFEGLNSKIPYIRAMAERMAINAPIQGTEADLIKLAMIRIDEYLKKENLSEKIKLILQVHDELVYEADESIAEKIAPKLEKLMESVISKEDSKGVIMKASSSMGENWKEMKKINS